MKKYALYLALFGLLSLDQQANAQVSLSLENSLNATLDSMKTVVNTKSLSAAIQTADGTVWSHAFGLSSAFVQATTNDRYLIGSVTKTIVSACVLELAEGGILQLDDSLHSWFPPMPFIDSNITIRQLMNHSSGLYDVLTHPSQPDSMNADFSRIWTAPELISYFLGPPYFAPGTSWSYSNTNYFLLGMLIEEATGQPFYTELRNRFFDPLGLNSFNFPSYENNPGPVSHVWIDLNGDGILDDAHNFYMNYLSLNSTAGAAGAYYCTPTDCSKWMRAYQRGDVVSSSSLAEAQTTLSAPASQGGLYGLGLMKNSTHFLGHLAYGHGGDLAYHASSWYFPAFDISISVLNNDNSKTSWNLLPVVRELLRTFLINQTASVAELSPDDFTFGPNPIISEITLNLKTSEAEDIISAYLFNSLGQKVETEVFINKQGEDTVIRFLNLESLDAGVYVVYLQNANGYMKSIKVMK